MTSLNLNNNPLTILPAEIGHLKNLTFLDLNANKLTSLPTEMGYLTNLKWLLLKNNPIVENAMLNIKRSLPKCKIYWDDPIERLEDKLSDTKDTTQRFVLYDTLVTQLERRYKKDTSNLQTKQNLAKSYDNFVREQLRQGLFADAEQNIRRGILVDAAHLYLPLRLPLSLLLQGKYAAAQQEYLRLKNKPFSKESNLPFYKDAFLLYLAIFEEKGIIPKAHQAEVEKIRALLRSQ